LDRIGVLEFVDEGRLEPVADDGGQVFAAGTAERSFEHEQQVVEEECVPVAFPLGKLMADGLDELESQAEENPVELIDQSLLDGLHGFAEVKHGMGGRTAAFPGCGPEAP